MTISSPFILRPVATTLLTLGCLLLGLIGYRLLPVAALPSVDFPTIQVTTALPGAGPDIMASSVTTPLEHQFGQISGLSAMSSISAFGTSQITLQFSLDRNIDDAAQDVQSAIAAASGLLPTTLPSPPTYGKVNPAETPVMILALTADTLPPRALSEAADTVVAQKLSQVDGVGLVTVEGGERGAERVEVDPAALAAMGLSLEDVRGALAAATVDLPKGGLDGARQSYQLGADDQLLNAEAYRRQIIAWRNGRAVRLGDVARIVDGVENDRLAAWYDGRPAVLLDVQRQPGANTIQVVDAVRRLLPQIHAALPPAVHLSVLADRTVTIRAAIADVQITLLVTILLVVLVIFLFLRKLWATVIPSVTLPVSLIVTFGVMQLCGFSLDNLSLMALAIAAGFVADDAIVMIENVARFIEAGETPVEAALKGAKQIGFTIVSLTVSLVAVFIPLLLMGGVVGRLFREFAVTLSVAVILSAVVSLTLTPMMCAQLLKPEGAGSHRRLLRWSERVFKRVQDGYARGLDWVLDHQSPMLFLTLATLIATVWLYAIIPKGFLPREDTGLILGVTDTRADTSFAALAARQQAVADLLGRDPDVAAIDSVIGAGTINPAGNSGRLVIALKPRGQRHDDIAAVIARLRRAVAGASGISLYLQPVQDIQIDDRASRTQYQYTLENTDPAELALWAGRLLAVLRQSPALADVASDQPGEGVETRLVIDRDAAARLGVDVQALDDTLYDAFGQRQIATLFTQTDQYKVILDVRPDAARDPKSLDRLYVGSTMPATKAGTIMAEVPLASLVARVIVPAPLVITHQGLFPSATLSFDVAPGHALGDALQAIAGAERAIGLPDSIAAGFGGTAAAFRATLDSELPLILAAIVTVYIVLGVLYESYIHPLTIISTLPSAGVGALLALMLCGAELSVISLIGILLLIGIVKKNAIMMIDFALDAQRRDGAAPREAIRRACILRFRPIMMTTMAALFGALPLALGHGTGSELRRPLGIAIVGGLLVSQVLTLYTTPVVYLAFERLRRRLGRRAGGWAGDAG